MPRNGDINYHYFFLAVICLGMKQLSLLQYPQLFVIWHHSTLVVYKPT